MTKAHQYIQKYRRKTPLTISGVGQEAKSPQNQSLDVAAWDSKCCRVKFQGKFVSIKTFDLTKLLHYRLVSKLDRSHARLLFMRLADLSLPPSHGALNIMVWRGRVAMTVTDLKHKLQEEVDPMAEITKCKLCGKEKIIWGSGYCWKCFEHLTAKWQFQLADFHLVPAKPALSLDDLWNAGVKEITRLKAETAELCQLCHQMEVG